MGFKADSFDDGKSEFDAVFSSTEGRFIGEAEGRDNKAINIDKFSQLMRNLHEDFDREEVLEIANGVLFGNGYRLNTPEERGELFTEKCLKEAKRIGIGWSERQICSNPPDTLLNILMIKVMQKLAERQLRILPAVLLNFPTHQLTLP